MHSKEIAELVKALSTVQGMLKAAEKDCTNPFFKSKYAGLGSIWNSCRESLAANGLAVIQTTGANEKGVEIVTTLAHTSGQWIRGTLLVKPVKDDPQAIGSAITYGRRYALAAIVGAYGGDEDDDGEGAVGRAAPAKPRPIPPTRPAADAEAQRVADHFEGTVVSEPEDAKVSGPKESQTASPRASGSPSCPKCGAEVVNQVGGKSKNGKNMPSFKCSTNRWNPETKKAEGCDWIEWDAKFFDVAADAPPPQGPMPQTKAQSAKPDAPRLAIGQRIRIDQLCADIVFDDVKEFPAMVVKHGAESGDPNDLSEVQANALIKELAHIKDEA